jgi:hypothetical protein
MYGLPEVNVAVPTLMERLDRASVVRDGNAEEQVVRASSDPYDGDFVVVNVHRRSAVDLGARSRIERDDARRAKSGYRRERCIVEAESQNAVCRTMQ